MSLDLPWGKLHHRAVSVLKMRDLVAHDRVRHKYGRPWGWHNRVRRVCVSTAWKRDQSVIHYIRFLQEADSGSVVECIQ